ncbi:adenosine deaminase 2 [Drosophila albomicans]|uniref:Adenosine deaminase n=1 Tax=Drosophila albomicans TaxID=7291 RepID=A0A6P8XJD3_DROAB|nr:adenosine deaminase 2 [Drosophila albomicans]XP_034111475.1 adenosine deaminase 2 [Drosophila albomicans]XP_034111476.1 adenosine deaminase 2 [Drosophila albomicans]
MQQRYNLIALLSLCLCLGLAESRTRPKALPITKYVYTTGSSSHVESLLGTSRPSPEAYKTVRNAFAHYEESRSLGYDLELDSREVQANETIMKAKINEYAEGEITPHLFNPSQHIFKVLDAINKTELFQLLRHMPKGAVLHAHDTALASTKVLIELTYKADLWICQQTGDLSAEAMRFAKEKPAALTDAGQNCDWSLLSDVRRERGAEAVDEYLAERLTLYPTTDFLDNNDAWTKFMKIFALLDGLLMYAPVWGEYYYKALEEFLADGVQYLEFRTLLPTLYDLEGTVYTPLDTVRIYVETLNDFMSKSENSAFIGSRMIYAPLRNTDTEGMLGYINTLKEIKEKYPDFLAGFDLVGQEELGKPLNVFIDQLLQVPDDIDFYFHAGETNWFGSTTDENLIDALLLGTKRIGHGFGLVKHPVVLDLVKKLNVAIEVSPVSNQVLQLVSDFRNHPCAQFFADGYPVVISSDDPSFWKATPLSHDFYIAFLGIASQHADLRLLKKLALNSIQYSSLSADAKYDALSKWQMKWDEFLDYVNNVSPNGATSYSSHGQSIIGT